MLEGLRELVELQTLDDDLAASEEQSAGIPAQRARLEERRAAAEERLARSRETLVTAEAEQRRAEADHQDSEALIAKLEGQQFQVKSNEAYTALLHELERAKQAKSDFETRILEAMEGIDAATREIAAAEEQAKATFAQGEAGAEALDKREADLAARLDARRAERSSVSERLDARLLEQYEKIAARRRPVVVRISQEICLGCRANIPPQLYIEILRCESLLSCSNCHRILIHERSLDSAPK